MADLLRIFLLEAPQDRLHASLAGHAVEAVIPERGALPTVQVIVIFFVATPAEGDVVLYASEVIEVHLARVFERPRAVGTPVGLRTMAAWLGLEALAGLLPAGL